MGVFEDEYPQKDGPFFIANYTSDKILKTLEPVLVIELDLGAFRRVWEMVEAEAKRHWPTRETMSVARAELRAVDAFRAAWEPYRPIPEPAPVVEPEPVDTAEKWFPERTGRKLQRTAPEPTPTGRRLKRASH